LGLAHPEAAAIGPNGDLYVTDSAHQTVTQVARGGRVVRTWGGAGTGPGEFRLANGGIAVDQHGRVYVADSGNARVQVFTKSGHFIRQIGAFGDEPGHFQFPWAIAVGPDGAVYLSDDRQTTLTKLSASGHQQWRLGEGEPGTPPDLVGHTHFGSLDSRGRLVVADDDSGRVVYVSPRGQEVDAFGTGASGDHENSLGHPVAADFPEGACDTTVDAHDFVYVTGCVVTPSRGVLVQVYDPAHRLVGAWPRSPLLTAPRFGPGDLAVAVGFDSILELSVDR
jgi:tripartite motif-containing protein 71